MLIAQTTALRNDSSHGIIHIHCIFWRPGDHYTLIGRCPNYVIAFIPSNMLMCDQQPLQFTRAHKSGTYFLNTAGTCTVLLHAAAIDCVYSSPSLAILCNVQSICLPDSNALI